MVIPQLRVGLNHAVAHHGVVMVNSMVKVTDMLAPATSKHQFFHQYHLAELSERQEQLAFDFG